MRINATIKNRREPTATDIARVSQQLDLKREELQTFVYVAQRYIKQHEGIIAGSKKKNDWQIKTATQCISLIKLLINSVKSKLGESRLQELREILLFSDQEHYGTSFLMHDWELNSEYFRLALFSAYTSIKHDVHWLGILDLRDLAKMMHEGKRPDDLTELFKYSTKAVKKDLPYLLNLEPFNSSQREIYSVAITCIEGGKFIAANLLLFPLIENLARSICLYVFKKQNPALSSETVSQKLSKHTHLESLFRDSEWHEDFLISPFEAANKFYYIENKEIDFSTRFILLQMNTTEAGKLLEQNRDTWQKMSETLLEQDKPSIQITIGQRLFLLSRRYRDERNIAIHGEGNGHEADWNALINLNILLDLKEVADYYVTKYKTA